MKIVDFDETKLPPKTRNHPKIKDLIDNEEPYIAELKAMTDKVLAQKLNTVRIQKQWAVEQENWISLDVLRLFEDMIIAARILKSEENPDSKEYDEPVARPKKKKETEIINEEQQDTKEQTDEIPETDDSNNTEKNNPEQLTLFDF